MHSETETAGLGYMDQLRAIRNNDEKALSLLYQKNYPAVERYIIENSGSADDARDVYQEAFIAAWRNIRTGKFEPVNAHSIDGYLYQVSKFKWIDQLRKQKRNPVVNLDPDADDWLADNDQGPQEDSQIKEIQKHFDKLGTACRDMLTRFYYLRQNIRTIATELGYTEPTAKNNKYRCLQKLRELIKNK
jgi:RNA polymerase sigma factor (sigma-70 family)